MKICIAQTRPAKGDIRRNIANHVNLVELASTNGADAIVFPELSLTGYEPALAAELAIDPCDDRLDVFQRLANVRQVMIGTGVPTKNDAGICISMIVFQPGEARRAYSKQYLHPDEEEFFIRGKRDTGLIGAGNAIALAICYELSVPAHANDAFRNGARIYIASVAKFLPGITKATERLAEIAGEYSMPALMANCVGEADGQQCAGRTSAWNDRGGLAGQLDDSSEGILIFDTGTQEAVAVII